MANPRLTIIGKHYHYRQAKFAKTLFVVWIVRSVFDSSTCLIHLSFLSGAKACWLEFNFPSAMALADLFQKIPTLVPPF